MGATTIEWCHYTHNVWWGCEKVSEGCKNCYAESFAKRTGHDVWGPGKGRRFFGLDYHAQPIKWNAEARAAGERRRVFCASMADVFERPPGELGQLLTAERTRLWSTIAATPQLDWLLLTKRPENILGAVPMKWLTGFPDNVWIGATAENQARFDERWPLLWQVPARVRFLSMEPLLERVQLRCAECGGGVLSHQAPDGGGCPGAFPNWIILGGESGGKAREHRLEWTRSILRQVDRTPIRAFVKQLGDKPIEHVPGPHPSEVLLQLTKAKGGNLDDFPADLRVRELPDQTRLRPLEVWTP